MKDIKCAVNQDLLPIENKPSLFSQLNKRWNRKNGCLFQERF
ncbi:hypothetical protein [Lysinibacillus sphaericus]|nr:hypothetical protein [Lysinibacillus sphaericus]